jgi:drug/metabolite transporter (DMT)-like permease
MIALIGLYVVLALSFSMSKGVLLHAEPVFFTGVRMVIAGVLLLGYQVFIRKQALKLRKEHVWAFAQLAFFHVFVAYVFEFWALETVSAAVDALFFNLTSFITALLSLVLCNERLSRKQWLGLVIGFVGFLPLFYAQQSTCASSVSSLLSCFSFSKAELLLVMAVSATAYGWIVMQKLVRDDVYHPVFVNGVSMLWGGFISLAVSFATETTFLITTTPDAFWTHDIAMFAWYLAVLIVLTNFISYNLYGILLKRYSATFIALAGGMTPIFTALFDWILFGELITWHFVVTVVLVCIGLCIFYLDELKLMRQSAKV